MELWDSNGKDFVMTTAPLKNHKPMNLKCPGVAKMWMADMNSLAQPL
jgi:hypothetical protein